MATPIGHSLFAGFLYREWKKTGKFDLPLIVVCIITANAPDLDFLPGILIGEPSRFHHGASHSLCMAVLFSVLLSFCLRKLKWFSHHSLLNLFSMGFVLYLSHLFLDLITLDNFYPYGMPLLWPFSAEYMRLPFYVFSNVARSDIAFTLSGFKVILNEVVMHNIKVSLNEILVFTPPLLCMIAFERSVKEAKVLKWFVVASILGIMLSISIKETPSYY